MKKIALLFFVFLTCIGLMNARTFNVNSVSSYNNAVSNSNSGDVIIWKKGTFKDIDIRLDKSGIVLKAEELGGTIFNGASKLLVTGNDNKIEGFQYIGGNITNDKIVIESRGDRNDFSHIVIKDYFCQKYVVFTDRAQRNKFSYSTFENRTFIGDKNIFQITISETESSYNVISHCQFLNFRGPGNGADYGVEPIRIGQTFKSDREFKSRCVVEYCYFSQCNGDAEIISNKSSENIYRYNTFENNPYGTLVLRHGSKCLVYGNYFLNGDGGVRIKQGQDHFVFNNYFSDIKRETIFLQNFNLDPLDNILIAHNTFVNTGRVRLGGSGDDKPTNVTIANNIFSSQDNNLFFDQTGTENWVSNIVDGTTGISNTTGFLTVDPKLKTNSSGYFALESNSPAIDESNPFNTNVKVISGLSADYDILLDVSKNDRPSNVRNKDIGSEEFGNPNDVKPHVSLANTGPIYNQTVNRPPTVSFTSPANNSTFVLGETITLDATASDSDGMVSRVRFKSNDDILKYASAPYQYDYVPTAVGVYTIEANAKDDDGANANDYITITVVENNAPTASFVTPLVRSVEEGYASLQVSVDATDPDGDDISLSLKIDGIEIRTEGNSPYDWGHQSTNPDTETELTGLPVGDHIFEVTVTDDKGASTMISTTITVTEQGVSFLSPIHDAYIEGTNGENNEVLRLEEGRRTIYLQFNAPIIPSGEEITEASIELTVGMDNGDGTIKVYNSSDHSWTEQNLEANSAPDVGEQLNEKIGPFNAVETYSFNVLGMSSSGGKLTFVLTSNGTGADDVSFDSKESTTGTAPVLRIKTDRVTSVSGTEESQFTIFPNPSENGMFNLSEARDWDVFNLKGEKMISGETESVDLTHQPNGFYILKVGGQVLKLVKE